MNKAYSRCIPKPSILDDVIAPVHPAVGWIVGNSACSSAHIISSLGSDKLPEVQLCMSTSCQTGSRVIRAFPDVEKPLYVLILAVTYDGPNGSLFISIPLHNSEFRILNSEFQIPKFALRISEFGIVKYM